MPAHVKKCIKDVIHEKLRDDTEYHQSSADRTAIEITDMIKDRVKRNLHSPIPSSPYSLPIHHQIS
jgi:hypothetical protein